MEVQTVTIDRKQFDWLKECERRVKESEDAKLASEIVPRKFTGGPLCGQYRGVRLDIKSHDEAGYHYEASSNGNFYCVGPVHDTTEDIIAHRRIDRLLELFCIVHPQMQLRSGQLVNSAKYVADGSLR